MLEHVKTPLFSQQLSAGLKRSVQPGTALSSPLHCAMNNMLVSNQMVQKLEGS